MSKSLMDRFIEKAEELGWSVDLESQENRMTGETETYAEFSQYSPAGEDYSFVEFYEDVSDLVDKVREAAEDFDVDEHIEMWIEARKNGVGGVPSTRELVHDAEEIKQMMENLASGIIDVYEEYLEEDEEDDES